MYLNKATILGNLTRDPEVKKMPSGTTVANLSIATNSSYTKKGGERVDKVEYHSVIVFGAVAENCGKYLEKGQSVFVDGSLTTRTWEKADGSKGYKTEIIARSVQFGPRRSSKTAPTEAKESEMVVDVETGEMTTATPKKETKNYAHPAVVSKGQKVSEDQIEYPEDSINPDDIPF